MKIAKDGIRSIVRIGYDGKVYKTFRGIDKKDRFENEIKVLLELEARGCDYVPRLIDSDEKTLTITTTNCGSPIEKMSPQRVETIFEDLRESFGILHGDPDIRNITYDTHRGRFCVIDFELADILGDPVKSEPYTRLSWAGLTKKGRMKRANEDSLSVFVSTKDGWADQEKLQGERDAKQDGTLIFAVSDGMGGHSGGDIASQLVVSELHHFLPAMMGNSESGSPTALIESAITALHSHVLRIADSRPEVADMGATVVCGLFRKQELYFGHVGDSRLYRFRGGRLKQLTDDHSFVGKLVQKGKLNEKQARLNPRRNVLTQAIGANCQFVHPQVGCHGVQKGDWFLICSDGIIDGLWDKQIEQEFLMAEVTHGTPESVSKNLLKRAYDLAGRDDTTLFVIRAE